MPRRRRNASFTQALSRSPPPPGKPTRSSSLKARATRTAALSTPCGSTDKHHRLLGQQLHLKMGLEAIRCSTKAQVAATRWRLRTAHPSNEFASAGFPDFGEIDSSGASRRIPFGTSSVLERNEDSDINGSGQAHCGSR